MRALDGDRAGCSMIDCIFVRFADLVSAGFQFR
jgi:hypothetical protein